MDLIIFENIKKKIDTLYYKTEVDRKKYLLSLLNDYNSFYLRKKIDEIIPEITLEIQNGTIVKYLDDKINFFNNNYDLISKLKKKNMLNSIILTTGDNLLLKDEDNIQNLDSEYNLMTYYSSNQINKKKNLESIGLLKYNYLKLTDKLILSFIKTKSIIIYTTGLGYYIEGEEENFFTNWIIYFMEEFLNLFENKYIIILNYIKDDDRNQSNKHLIYENTNIYDNINIKDIVEKNKLNLINIYINDFLEEKDIINLEKNYIILDFAHYFYYSHDNFSLGEGEERVEKDFYLNTFYFGFNNLNYLHDTSFVNNNIYNKDDIKNLFIINDNYLYDKDFYIKPTIYYMSKDLDDLWNDDFKRDQYYYFYLNFLKLTKVKELLMKIYTLNFTGEGILNNNDMFDLFITDECYTVIKGMLIYSDDMAPEKITQQLLFINLHEIIKNKINQNIEDKKEPIFILEDILQYYIDNYFKENFVNMLRNEKVWNNHFDLPKHNIFTDLKDRIIGLINDKIELKDI